MIPGTRQANRPSQEDKAGRAEPPRCRLPRRSGGATRGRSLHEVALGDVRGGLRVLQSPPRCGHPHRKPTNLRGVRGRTLSTSLAYVCTPTACATGESRGRRGARPGRRAPGSWQLVFGSQSELRSAPTLPRVPARARGHPRFHIDTIASETDRSGVRAGRHTRHRLGRSDETMGLTSKNRTSPLLLSEWHAPKPHWRVWRIDPLERTMPASSATSVPGAQ